MGMEKEEGIRARALLLGEWRRWEFQRRMGLLGEGGLAGGTKREGGVSCKRERG